MEAETVEAMERVIAMERTMPIDGNKIKTENGNDNSNHGDVNGNEDSNSDVILYGNRDAGNNRGSIMDDNREMPIAMEMVMEITARAAEIATKVEMAIMTEIVMAMERCWE